MQAFESETKRKTICTALHLILDSSPPTTLCSYRVSPLASTGKTSQHKASVSLTMTGPEVPWGVPADKLNTDSLFSNMGEPVQSALHWMCQCVFLCKCACVCVCLSKSIDQPAIPVRGSQPAGINPDYPWHPDREANSGGELGRETLNLLGLQTEMWIHKNMHIYIPDYITLLPQVSQSRRLCKKKIPEPISVLWH